ncbi:MAG: hypothetical protein ACRCXD_04050 [Luteolibacter sp.]
MTSSSREVFLDSNVLLYSYSAVPTPMTLSLTLSLRENVVGMTVGNRRHAVHDHLQALA